MNWSPKKGSELIKVNQRTLKMKGLRVKILLISLDLIPSQVQHCTSCRQPDYHIDAETFKCHLTQLTNTLLILHCIQCLNLITIVQLLLFFFLAFKHLSGVLINSQGIAAYFFGKTLFSYQKSIVIWVDQWLALLMGLIYLSFLFCN